MTLALQHLFAEVTITTSPAGAPPTTKLKERNKDTKKRPNSTKLPYIPMKFVPSRIARGTYLGYQDDITVQPPQFRRKPTYPRFQDLGPKDGVAIVRSPVLRVYPMFILELLWVILLARSLMTGGSGTETKNFLLLVVVNAFLTWFAYLSWMSEAIVVTLENIHRYTHVYATVPETFNSADINGVRNPYRRPAVFWKLLGFSVLNVTFSSSSAEQPDVWTFKDVANGEAAASLVRGLQSNVELVNKRQLEIAEEALAVAHESLEVQRAQLAASREAARLQQATIAELIKRLDGFGEAMIRIMKAVEAPQTNRLPGVQFPTANPEEQRTPDDATTKPLRIRPPSDSVT